MSRIALSLSLLVIASALLGCPRKPKQQAAPAPADDAQVSADDASKPPALPAIADAGPGVRMLHRKVLPKYVGITALPLDARGRRAGFWLKPPNEGQEQLLTIDLERNDAETWAPSPALPRISRKMELVYTPPSASETDGAELRADIAELARRLATFAPPWSHAGVATTAAGKPVIYSTSFQSWLVHADGTLKNLGAGGAALLSPAGDHAAWTGPATAGDKWRLHVRPVADGKATEVDIVDVQEHRWSPDGAFLYVRSQRCLHVVDTKTYAAKQVYCLKQGTPRLFLSENGKYAAMTGTVLRPPAPPKLDIAIVSLPDGAVIREVNLKLSGSEHGALSNAGVLALRTRSKQHGEQLTVVDAGSGKIRARPAALFTDQPMPNGFTSDHTLVTWDHAQSELLELHELDLEKLPMTDATSGKL